MPRLFTYSGGTFDPIAPDAADLRIEDIAHALALMTRANGHFPYFFSVCQHSVNCALEARARGYTRRVQLACLLHDATEAYLADITRPVKQLLPLYQEREAALAELIFGKWLDAPLTDEERRLVRTVDDAMLRGECMALAKVALCPEAGPLAAAPDLRERPWRECEAQFLALFAELRG